jgi:hypothetical protein
MKNFIFLKIQKFNFASKLFSKENLKNQIGFNKKSNSSDISSEIEKLNLKIKNMENKLEQIIDKNYDAKIITIKSTSTSKEHLIYSDLRKAKNELTYLKSEMNPIPIKEKDNHTMNKEHLLRNSHFRDVLSFKYRYDTKFVNEEFYLESRKDKTPWKYRELKERVDEDVRKFNKEIETIIDSRINKELKSFNPMTTEIPHQIASEPFLHTKMADDNIPPEILLESDLNNDLTPDLEIERIVYAIQYSDDFGKNRNEQGDIEQDKKGEPESLSIVDKKMLRNQQKFLLNRDRLSKI